MFRIVICVLVLARIVADVSAQRLSLQGLSTGDYTPETISSVTSLADGLHYTQLTKDGKAIVKYAYKNGNAVDTLFNVKTAKACTFDRVEGYTLSQDERVLLLYTHKEPIYRHSFKADYYTCELRRNLVKPLSENGKQQNALLSPNGRVVAFVRDRNIFLKKLDFGTESQVTTDGRADSIINGIPDWAYEEEFRMHQAMAWSPDSELLSFLKFNESDVPAYSIQLYEGMCPAYPMYALYPGTIQYKYPLPGEKRAQVGVYTFELDSKVTRKMNIPVEDGAYFPRLTYSGQENQLVVTTLNRLQNQLRLYGVNAKSGVSRLLLQDENQTWIEPENFDFLRFYPDFFIFASSKSGYRHLYRYSPTGSLQKQITHGNYDVTAFLGYDALTKSYFYQAADKSPITRSVYRIDEKGKIAPLATKEGMNSAAFNTTFTYFVHTYSSLQKPPVVRLCTIKGDPVRILEANEALQTKLSELQLPKKELFSFTNEQGDILYGWLLMPAKQETKAPLFLWQYGGPGSQSVLDRWEMGWEYALVSNGYAVACVDGRGTGGRGTAFSHQIYRRLGIAEMEDQLSAARYLSKRSEIDSDRIGIGGWSYGGFVSLMAITEPNTLFKTAIAIAPVTDWKYYDAIYTERYMQTPKENFEGYALCSPLNRAKDLQGELLLVSGTADDNVHLQNSLQFTEALVQADKLFDMHYYTNRNHGIKGCNTRYHLYQTLLRFLKRTL